MLLHACRIPKSNHRAPSLKLCRYTLQQVLNQWLLGQICCNVKKPWIRQFISIKLEKRTVNIGRFHMKCWIFGFSWKTKGLVLSSTFQHQSAGAECSRPLHWGVGCLLPSAHWGWGHLSFSSCPQCCFTYSGETLPPWMPFYHRLQNQRPKGVMLRKTTPSFCHLVTLWTLVHGTVLVGFLYDLIWLRPCRLLKGWK